MCRWILEYPATALFEWPEYLTNYPSTEVMNLSSIIHNEHRNSHSHSHQQATPQFHRPLTSRNRTAPSHERNMATVLTPNPYTSQPHLYTHATHPSPSPSVEDPCFNRLPSIQSLIDMPDPDIPENEQPSKL